MSSDIPSVSARMRARMLGFNHVACPTCKYWDMPLATWCRKRERAPAVYKESYRACSEYDPNPKWLETHELKTPK